MLFLLLLSVMFVIAKPASSQIYVHNFNAAFNPQVPPFVDVPNTLAANLSASSWTNNLPPNNAFTGTGGSAGPSLSVQNAGNATFTYTLTFKVASGFKVAVTSFSFWRRNSGNGPANWSMTINGIAVGAGVNSSGGASTGNLAVSNAVNNITGTVTVVLSLLNSPGNNGTFRLDDFTLNGSVTPAPTLSATTLTDFGDACLGSVSGANTFDISGTTLTAANVTVASLTGFTFSKDNTTFTNTLSLAQPGGTYAQTIYVKFSPVALVDYSGDITVGGGGAPSVTVAAQGVGVSTKPAINNGTVSNITTNSADITANISDPGCTTVTAYGIKYSTTAGFDPVLSGTTVAGGALVAGNFTSNLSALAPPGQTYYFHTFATNTGGTTYGTEGSFTLYSLTATLSVPSAGAGSLADFGNVCVNTASINSFNLSGSVLNGTSVMIGALARYSYSRNPGGPFTNTLTLANGFPGYSAGVLSVTVYVRFIPTLVQSYNGNIPVTGGGAPAIAVAATGSGINSAPLVTTGNALFVTTNSASLPGTIDDPGCGVTLAYGIEYSTAPFAPGAGTVLAASNLAAGNFSVNLSGLLSSTTYYFYAYATNAGGTTYGASNSFTTFDVPTKLVIIPGSVSPASPTALAAFSVTVQAQDNLGNAVDVTVDTDIQFAQSSGTFNFTFPNGNIPAATMPAGSNTIVITDLSYDTPETGVGITAATSAGMSLTTSAPITFDVIAYVGPTTFIWGANGSGGWFVSSGAQHWVTPAFVISPVPPGASSGVNNHLAKFTNYAALVNPAALSFNMTNAGGVDYSVGAISFEPSYNTFHTSNIISMGNSSTTVSGTISFYGSNVVNLGGISGNNYTDLLLGNYMGNATTKTFQIVNATSGTQKLTVNFAAPGSVVAGVGNSININTFLTGTQPIKFAGGGSFTLTPSGVSNVNTFTGPVTVTRGTLIAGNSGAFSAVTPVDIILNSAVASAGILRLDGNNITIGGLSTQNVGGAATVDNGAASATLTIKNTGAQIFNGKLKDGTSGNLSLIKTGTGTITLTGTNTLTGSTTINSGRLVFNKTGGGTYPAISDITINGPGQLQISKDQTIRDLTIAGSGVLIVDAGVTLTITGNYNAAACNINNLGTIKLQGAATQSFPGTAAIITNMNNVTINNLFGVDLNNSLNIKGTLLLTVGTFTVGPYTLTINNPITGNLANFAADNSSSMVIAGTAAGVDVPGSVSQLKALTVSNTVGSTLQGNLNLSATLFITSTAGVLYDNQYVLNGTASVTMTGGTLNLEQNTAVLPGLTGVYLLTAGNVIFNGVGLGTDAQTVRPVNYFNLTSASTGDRILSPTGVIGVANTFTPNLPLNLYTVINSTVDYNKASPQFVAGFNYYNITVSGGAFTKTLNGDIQIQGALSLATNTKFSLANFNTTLKSDASNTANVAAINTDNSIAYGTGRFIVERYIPTGIAHGKSWQLLAVPVSGTQSVKAAWQEGNNPLVAGTAGFGTTISSERAGAVARGYDFYTAIAPSLKTYSSGTAAWVGVDDGVTNTASLPIANKKGYMILVRGDRSVQTSGGTANETTLRTSGKIFSPGTDAPATSAVAAGKFETVGNPYASVIDFVTLQSASSGIDSKYYVWDPLLPGTGGLGLGGYQLLSSSNLWKPVPGGTTNYPTGTAYTKIQSGQAFFVFSTGGGTVNFDETQKVSGSSLLFRQAQQQQNTGFLRSWLKGASNGIITDGNVVTFSDSFQNSFDADDAIKLSNGTESFGITANARTLALEARSPVLVSDTVFYNIDNLLVKEYQIAFEPEHMNTTGLSAYLVDKYLTTATNIDLSAATTFNFLVTNDPLSKQRDRFYIVFKRLLAPVPVTFVRVAANRNAAGTIDVNWSVENEINLQAYQVTKSSDGRNFTGIYDQRTVYNNGQHADYDFTDQQSSSASVFYRIKAISNNGQFQYSNIVEVKGWKSEGGISIFPNPVEDKTIHVSMIGQTPGEYQVQLINNIGQIFYKGVYSVQSQNSGFTIKLGTNVEKGIYQLNITNASMKSSKKVFIQ